MPESYESFNFFFLFLFVKCFESDFEAYFYYLNKFMFDFDSVQLFYA